MSAGCDVLRDGEVQDRERDGGEEPAVVRAERAGRVARTSARCTTPTNRTSETAHARRILAGRWTRARTRSRASRRARGTGCATRRDPAVREDTCRAAPRPGAPRARRHLRAARSCEHARAAAVPPGTREGEREAPGEEDAHATHAPANATEWARNRSTETSASASQRAGPSRHASGPRTRPRAAPARARSKFQKPIWNGKACTNGNAPSAATSRLSRAAGAPGTRAGRAPCSR